MIETSYGGCEIRESLKFCVDFLDDTVQSIEHYIDASIQIEHGEQRRFGHYQTHIEGFQAYEFSVIHHTKSHG